MKFSRSITVLAALLFATVLFVSAAGAEELIGGTTGTFRVCSDVEGADVTFISISGDEYPAGKIANGYVDYKVYLTATPFKQIRVEAEGYDPITVSINEYPEINGVLTIDANIANAAESQAIGGSQGIFRVKCNIENSTVTFISISGNEQKMGQIKDGYLDVPVYLTATPFKQIRIDGEGFFEPIIYDITQYPEAGQTLTVSIDFPTDPNLDKPASEGDASAGDASAGDASAGDASAGDSTAKPTPGIAVIGTIAAVLAAGFVSKRHF